MVYVVHSHPSLESKRAGWGFRKGYLHEFKSTLSFVSACLLYIKKEGDMDTQEAIKFVASFRTNKMGLVGYQLSAKQVRARNDKLNDVTYILASGELYRKMWKDFKSTYGYRTTYNSSGDQQLCRLEDIMDKAEVAFLGSKPKTKHQRLNEVIDRLGVYMQVGKMSEIIKLLVELRDEEEDV